MSMTPYASAIGSIMYAMLCTRPDVSYTLNITSIYQSDLGKGHRVVVKNILKYVRRTKDVFLNYRDGDLIVSWYIDASFQSNRDESKSQLSYVLH